MPRQMYSKFMFLFFIRYVRNRIDHWCTVEPGNPNPHHPSSGKLDKASFPTGTVNPRVGISLSPLNTNDGFSLYDRLSDLTVRDKEKVLLDKAKNELESFIYYVGDKLGLGFSYSYRTPMRVLFIFQVVRPHCQRQRKGASRESQE